MDKSQDRSLPGRNSRSVHTWLRLAGLTLLALGLGMATNTLDPALLSFKVAELEPVNRNTALGFIAAAGLLVATLTQPAIGVVSDRTRSPLGRRVPYMIVGSLVAVAFLFGIALAPSLAILTIGVLAYQFGANTAQAPWQALLPDQLPPSLRGAASGLKSLFEIVGFILGRSLAGFMVAEGTPETALVIVGVVFLISMVISSVTTRLWRPADLGGHVQAPDQTTGETGRAPSIPRKRWPRGFGWWFLNRFLFWAGIIAINSFVIFYLVDAAGMTLGAASRLFGELSVVLGVSLLVITIPAGRLSDRVGRRPIIMAACIVAAAGNLLLLLAQDRAALIIAGGALGLATGVFLSASWALATELVPPMMAARYLGIANIATAGGSFVARLAGGALIDPINRITGSPEAGYRSLYALTLLGFVIAALAVTRLPKRQPAESNSGAGA